MKKLFFLAMSILLAQGVFADDDKIIDATTLPVAAKEFISQNFGPDVIQLAKEERGLQKDINVYLRNGDRIEFDKKGTWKEVKSKNGVPKNIIPLDIQNSVKEQFKTAKIIGIEKEDKNRIEVDLDNGIEFTFNKNGDLVEID